MRLEFESFWTILIFTFTLCKILLDLFHLSFKWNSCSFEMLVNYSFFPSIKCNIVKCLLIFPVVSKCHYICQSQKIWKLIMNCSVSWLLLSSSCLIFDFLECEMWTSESWALETSVLQLWKFSSVQKLAMDSVTPQ